MKTENNASHMADSGNHNVEQQQTGNNQTTNNRVYWVKVTVDNYSGYIKDARKINSSEHLPISEKKNRLDAMFTANEEFAYPFNSTAEALGFIISFVPFYNEVAEHYYWVTRLNYDNCKIYSIDIDRGWDSLIVYAISDELELL